MKNNLHVFLGATVADAAASPLHWVYDQKKLYTYIKGKKDTVSFSVKDQGPGFSETNTDKIFKRFYSNRPEKFGEHSGLGLNIVKSIVEMHGGNVQASNRTDNQKGAQIEVVLPKKYNQ